MEQSETRALRIAFVTPTLHTLGPRWRRDPQIVKLAGPTLCGFLYSRGYEHIRQYDFEVQVFQREEEAPGSFPLELYVDDARVDAFLRGEDEPAIRALTERILDALEVEEADLFCFSTASVLELYADMHSAGNINMCLATVLKERHPNCKTAIGGLQISPESKHKAEYQQMLGRCAALDFAIEGKGEWPILHVAEALEGRTTFEGNEQRFERHGQGMLLLPVRRLRDIHVPAGIARQEGLKGVTLNVLTPEEEPEGEHKRQELVNQSIYVTPYFDPKNIEARRLSGIQILKRYNLDTEWVTRMSQFHGDSVVVLPMIFMEGCNSHCSFCSYSMTKMIKRDVEDAVRAIAWLREKYDVRYFHFLNTNINGYYKYAEAFADALIAAKLDILWSDCANLRALDRPLLEKLRKSGLIRFTYGLECPSDRMLKYIMKGITVKQAYDRLKEAHEVGIWNHLLLITGLPTETEEDQKHFIDFLERTAEFTHGFSISSFYLVSTSLMGAFPQRFGLEMMPNPSGLLEDAAFNEVGGLTWERKKRQIIESTEVITETIKRLKVEPKYWSGAIDLELLFWLYDRLGHDNKADIVRAYEDAFIGVPAHPKSYTKPLREALRVGTPGTKALRQAGWQPKPEAITVREEALLVPFESERSRVSLELRCHEHGAPPTLTAGRNLGVSVSSRPWFADALLRLVGTGGALTRALEAAGFEVVERGLAYGLGGFGFRILRKTAAVDLFVVASAPDTPAFLRQDNLGFVYSVPHGATDPTRDKKVLEWLTRLGRYVLGELNKDRVGAQSKPVDAALLKATADELVSLLEAPFARALDEEARHARNAEGQRHGPDFSKVATALPRSA